MVRAMNKMWMMRAAALAALVLGAAVARDAGADQVAVPPAAAEVPAAKAQEVLKVFEKLLDTIVANQNDCGKLADAMNTFVDTNAKLLKEMAAFEAKGQRLPADVEAKLSARMQKDMQALQKCASDKQVQGAMMRLGNPDLPRPAKPDPSISAPTQADLDTYLKAVKGKGDLLATFSTPQGTIKCKLLPEKAPATVANFIGLAMGKKPWMDPKTNKVMKNKPFYNGLVFHRVIPDFMIQGGDPLGSGVGGPGYDFADETNDMQMTEGMLAMANSGPNTNGSQFFITEAAATHLTGKHTIFGTCQPLEIVKKIARVKSTNDKPDKAVTMKVKISRGKY